MSFEFILEMILMVSVGAVLYGVARALPRVSDVDSSRPRPAAPSWVTHYLERADERLLSFSEKALRRFRVMLLKLDNGLSKKIGRLKKDVEREATFTPEVKAVVAEEKKEEAPPLDSAGPLGNHS